MRVLTEGFFERFYTSPPNLPLALRWTKTQSASSTNCTVTYTVPNGYDAIITHALARSIAGAAQAHEETLMKVLNEAGANAILFLADRTTGPTAGVYTRWATGMGTLYVLSRNIIDISVTFTAGAAANTLIGYLTGMLVPQCPTIRSP